MKKYHIALLSALILLSYGFLAEKIIFISLGITFLLVALATYLTRKK